MVSNLTASRSLPAHLPSSMSAWQLPRQFAIVLRFGWKERVLVEAKSGCLIGREVDLRVLCFVHLAVKRERACDLLLETR